MLDAEEGDLGSSKKEEAMRRKEALSEVRWGPVVNYRASRSRQVWLTQSAGS